MPKISIITVNLNDKDGLERTIKSVVAQSYDDYEYIVVDGASDDGSAEVIEENKDNIHKVKIEADKGIYEAMNKGIKMAEGEYLLFLNSGDYLVDDSEILNKIETELTTDIVAFDCLIAKDGEVTGKRTHRGKPSLYYVYKNGLKHQSTFVRKELFEKLGYYDESFRISGDYEFWIRALLDPKTTIEYKDFSVAVFELGGISQNNIWGNEHLRVEQDLLPHLIDDFKLYEKLIPYQNSALLKSVRNMIKIAKKPFKS